MNNSFLADLSVDLEVETDNKAAFRQRETELVKIIEAIEKVASTSEWQALKPLIFDGLVESLESRLKSESKKNELNAPEIYRLNGQLKLASQYADLSKLSNAYRQELLNVRKHLNAKND